MQFFVAETLMVFVLVYHWWARRNRSLSLLVYVFDLGHRRLAQSHRWLMCRDGQSLLKKGCLDGMTSLCPLMRLYEA